MKYYLHNDTGYYDAYFGNVGKPREVTKYTYLNAVQDGYVATKASDGMSICDVHILAQINAGAHPNSYKVEMLREAYAKLK